MAEALPNSPTPRTISKYFRASMVLLPSSHFPQRRGGVMTACPAAYEEPGNSSAPMQVVACRRNPAGSVRASLRFAQRCDAKARASSAVPRASSARTEILRAVAGLIIKKAARNSSHSKATAAAAASIVAMTSVAKVQHGDHVVPPVLRLGGAQCHGQAERVENTKLMKTCPQFICGHVYTTWLPRRAPSRVRLAEGPIRRSVGRKEQLGESL